MTEVLKRYSGLVAILLLAFTVIIWPNRKPSLGDDVSAIDTRSKPDTFLIELPQNSSNELGEKNGEVSQKKNKKRNDNIYKKNRAEDHTIDNSEDIAPNIDILNEERIVPFDIMVPKFNDSIRSLYLRAKVQPYQLVHESQSGSLPIDLTFRTGTSSVNERMVITKEGNVGIGTIYPQSPLHLNTRDSNIIEKIRIQHNFAQPDYVSSRKYPLLSDSITINYLKPYKQLSGIPSAAEVVVKHPIWSDELLSQKLFEFGMKMDSLRLKRFVNAIAKKEH